MDESLIIDLEPPRFENGRMLLIAGLGERYTFETNHGIPHNGSGSSRISATFRAGRRTAYGVCCNGDGAGNFDYIAGVEVSNFDDMPDGFSRVRIPAQRYAVFSHRDHVSRIRATVYTIWNKWLPASGHEHADAPDFERYDERFDPRTGPGTSRSGCRSGPEPCTP